MKIRLSGLRAPWVVHQNKQGTSLAPLLPTHGPSRRKEPVLEQHRSATLFEILRSTARLVELYNSDNHLPALANLLAPLHAAIESLETASNHPPPDGDRSLPASSPPGHRPQ